MEYDLDVARILKEVKNSHARIVGLQFPEGLKDKAVKIARTIEDDTDAITVIFVDPTYGACDLKQSLSDSIGVDLLIHFGHTEFGI